MIELYLLDFPDFPKFPRQENLVSILIGLLSGRLLQFSGTDKARKTDRDTRSLYKESN